MPRLLLTIALVGGLLPSVRAHDAGVSHGQVLRHDTDLVVQLTFAQPDIESLLRSDRDRDVSLNPKAFAALQSALESTMAAGVEVSDKGKALAPASINTQLMPEDTLVVELRYAIPEAAKIEVRTPLLAQLPRGHRLYLTVHGAQEGERARYLLDRTSAAIRMQVPAAGALAVFLQHLVEGVWHIWIGYDHILFVLTLLLPGVLVYGDSGWQPQGRLGPALLDILKVVTAFTAAHSVTLALAVLGLVSLPSRLVESVIALSVLVVALNNLRPLFPASRWVLAFAFGLVHGFGFAGVLTEVGLPDQALFVSLLGFNLGVEAAQMAVVALVFPLTAMLRYTKIYRTWVFAGGSVTAALVATLWIVERTFDYQVRGL